MYSFIGCFSYVPWLENELTTLAHRQDTNQLSYQARATRGNFEKWNFWVRGHEDAVSGWLFSKWSPESLHERTLPRAFQSKVTAPACSSASGIPGVLRIPIRATKLCWPQNYSSQSFYQQIRGLFGNSKKLQCRTIKLYKNHRQAPQLKERYVTLQGQRRNLRGVISNESAEEKSVSSGWPWFLSGWVAGELVSPGSTCRYIFMFGPVTDNFSCNWPWVVLCDSTPTDPQLYFTEVSLYAISQ